MGRPIQQIDVFALQDRRAHGKAKPWVVRWRLEGRQRTKSFRTRAESDRYRSLLSHAAIKGETFDERTGEPARWNADEGDLRLHQWARRWLAEQWPEWQPRTRASVIEALARFLPLAVHESVPPAPSRLRSYLKEALEPLTSPDPDSDCERRLGRHSPRLCDLDKDLLGAVDRRLGIGDAGQPLSAATAARLRKVARACVRRALELDLIPADPWPPAQRGRSSRKAVRSRRVVDPHLLPDPATMRRILDAMATHQPASRTYRLMTAAVYYAGLRPSEVVMLRRSSLSLPSDDRAWGRVNVSEADIDNDTVGEPKTGPRSVPIPPVLVDELRRWIEEHSLEPDQLLFRTRTGRRPASSNWNRAWHRTLRSLGAPSWRIYDCRHAAATTWLASGAPLGEVARRLGHTVDTLVSTYVGALIGDEQLTNDRIAAALGEQRQGLAAA